MKLSTYRALIQRLMDYDSNKEPYSIIADVIHAGDIQFELPEFAKVEHSPDSLPFYLEVGGNAGSAYLCLFENGERAIVMDRDYFVNNELDRIKAVLAHEVGHFLSNHHKNNCYGRQLHVKMSRLERLSYEASRSDESSDLRRYFRAMMFSLVRGGCLTREMEADIVATLYVSVDSLIAVHSEDLTHSNPAAVLEKMNRLKWLNDLRKEITDRKLDLEIKLKS